MNYWIGTSGFQYPAWKGKFYPEKMPAGRMLPYYSERFTSTEINYTFRRIPAEKTIRAWTEATPVRFAFSFKAPQRVTHFAKLRDCAEVLDAFQRAISVAAGKCGPVLFQLPPTFTKDLGLLRAFVGALPKGMRAAFEFRHQSWFEDDVFETLCAGEAALCIAENEELVTPSTPTAPFGYLRLRREDYTGRQIQRWAKWIGEQKSHWSEVFIYFKHEDRAVGPKFANQMLAQISA